MRVTNRSQLKKKYILCRLCDDDMLYKDITWLFLSKTLQSQQLGRTWPLTGLITSHHQAQKLAKLWETGIRFSSNSLMFPALDLASMSASLSCCSGQTDENFAQQVTKGLVYDLWKSWLNQGHGWTFLLKAASHRIKSLRLRDTSRSRCTPRTRCLWSSTDATAVQMLTDQSCNQVTIRM